MITVTLLVNEPGRLRVEAGRVDFCALPVLKADEYQCSPPDLISFDDAKAISAELAKVPPIAQGRIGRYLWRKDN